MQAAARVPATQGPLTFGQCLYQAMMRHGPDKRERIQECFLYLRHNQELTHLQKQVHFASEMGLDFMRLCWEEAMDVFARQHQNPQSDDGIDSEFDKITPLILLKDTGPIIASYDEGNTWTALLNLQKHWRAASSAANGRVVCAAIGTGTDDEPIYVYDGKAWLEPSLESYVSGGWRSLAGSSTMQYIAAVADDGRLFLSDSQGNSWQQVSGLSNVIDVAVSDDGKDMASIQGGVGGYIQVSHDFGQTWTPSINSNGWETITMTGDGRTIVAAENSGYVFVSVNGGTVWSQRPEAGHWREISISKTGSTLVAVRTGTPPGKKILVSKNLGQTWQERGPEKQWTSVMMVPNGSKMVAVATNEFPYMSVDGGQTWAQRTSFGKYNWTCVALSAVSDKQKFEELDDPPTIMKTTVRIPTLEASRDTQNQRYLIYLEKYFLDAVWRDSEFPDQKLTANSGTSKSDKIFVTFYAGDIQQNIRLIEQNERSQTGVDCDVILHRDADHIGEVSSFYEYTSKDVFDSNFWFENQFTNQSNRYMAPGLFIGRMNVQALLALRRVPLITVKMENNRTDKYKSPFWYRKFLTGVSLFNEDTGKYEIAENGTPSFQYFRKVGNIILTKADAGPYQPASLYTFAQPLHEELFDGDLSEVFSVQPSANGSINLMSDERVELVLGQVALPPTATNANVLASYVIPGSTKLANGEFSPHPIYAQSDMESYLVSTADGAGGWTSTNPSMTAAGSVETLPFPNGSWRGVPLKAQNTAFSEIKSAFPWERSLTADQLRILDGKLAYNAAAYGTQVLSTENYLYMPSGDFGEKVGERSLQVDLGKQSYVNKLQLIFPKSQERWQPTRLNASLQRAWPGTNPDTYVDVYPSFWHQGFQGREPYGKNDGRETKYIHTLSQRWPVNGKEGEMVLGEHTGNLTSTYNISGNAITLPVTAYNLPVIVDAPNYADAITMEVASAKTFGILPNHVNPTFDFKRFEYGPFYQGVTSSWLRTSGTFGSDEKLGNVQTSQVLVVFPMAVCPKYREPSWDSIEKPNGFSFTNFVDWLGVPASETALGGLLSRYLPTAYSFRFSLPFFGAPDGFFEFSASSGNALAAFDFSTDTYWEAGGYSGNEYVPGTVTSASNYVGTTQTFFNVPGIPTPVVATGEWLQIKAPRPILIDGTLVEPRQHLSVWQIVNVSSSTQGTIRYPNGVTTGPDIDPTASIVIDSSFKRFTMTTSSGLYAGPYIGTASPLPAQAEYDYQPGMIPDYTGLPMTQMTGEWFSVEFDRPKRIKGFSLTTGDVRQAPKVVALFCQNDGDPNWYFRGQKSITNWEQRPETLDDDTPGDPRGFTRWAVVVPEVQINYVVEAPAHTMVIYDSFLGREIRANVEQRAYTNINDLVNSINQAINAETNGQIIYTLTWNSSTSEFRITNTGIQLDLNSSSSGPYAFSIIGTDLATLLGFSASSSPATSFTGAPTPPIIPTAPTRATFSITFYETGETDQSGNGNVVDQDQPTIMRVLGSNDGVSWTLIGTTDPTKSWRSRGGRLTLDQSFFLVAGVRQKRTTKYQYFRFVFLATQKSTSVRVSRMAVYAFDYDSPEYAETIVQGTAPVFELDYLTPNDRDDLYGDLYDWLLQKFSLYQIYNGDPLLDYIVKEEYYFAPNIDQADRQSVSADFGTYRPNYKAVAQKMLTPKFAQGRYAGLAVGYESTNRGFYEGNVSILGESVDPSNGRDHKCFSWRLCHQLYDFYTKGGEILDGDNDDAVKAKFNKRFEGGMLTGIGLVDGGLGYISSKLGDADVSLGEGTETLVNNDLVEAYAKANKVVGPNEVVDNVLYTSNISSESLSTYLIDTVQLTGSGNVLSQTTASEKSPLYRKADFLLSFQNSVV